MQVCDLYKLVYQAAMGGEHLLAHSNARESFFKEVEQLEPLDGELFEKIHPENTIRRVNLKVAKAQHIDSLKIWAAVHKSAYQYVPSSRKIKRWWKAVREFCVENQLLDDVNCSLSNEFNKFDGLTSCHHSRIYREKYSPSYRLVMPSVWKSLLMKDIDK